VGDDGRGRQLPTSTMRHGGHAWIGCLRQETIRNPATTNAAIVADEFEEENVLPHSSRNKIPCCCTGRLGGRAFPHLSLPPTPILPTSIGPATTNVLLSSACAARATLPPASTNYAHRAHFDLTVPTSSEIQNYNRR
jgi:hypothetical protein